ncbi:DUF4268 domain-containing protein [Novosphingobium panipatense]|uniref:DUF4268 domain-containing protein n=1 Tax=Novosphingobium panipatense TaxID=428991 RepID=A0ABY1Q3Y2_9SPHN|nr:DUF4268 domain-containing protein [Novosphingobium panipatense]SMP54181.1 protein of unknown function [Novosphingobium panipatense]
MTVKLGKVIQVDVRKAWPNEAAHFTPWLASPDGLELLQDALGMDLEVEATEQFIGPFRADILAKRTDTPDEHWVLIENQLEKTDHRHLGQLLTYAAGLKAATIVWVAQDFAEEHRAALDWLNDITSEDYQFFGLQIELWQIGASDPAPMLNVLAEPNEWTREVKQSAEGGVSDLKQQQMNYWQGLRTRLLEKKSKVRPQKAHPQSWTTFAIGRADTWLGACVQSQKKYIWAEFCFRGPAGKVWYDELFAQKDAIEAEFGAPLSWERLDGKKQSRIAIYLEGVDPTNEADWPRQHEWLIQQLEKMRPIFQPRALALSDGNSMPETDSHELTDET